MEKILRINMSSLSTSEEKLSKEYAMQGGKGLSSSIIMNE